MTMSVTGSASQSLILVFENTHASRKAPTVATTMSIVISTLSVEQ